MVFLKPAKTFYDLRRRHSTFKDLFFDRLGPGTCGRIVAKKGVGVTAWLMARETVILKDANDFFVETNLGGNGFVRAGWVRSKQEENCCDEQRQPNKRSSFSRITSHVGLFVSFRVNSWI